MFDFYRELILEMQGIKPNKKLNKEREYIGSEKEKTIITTKAKVLIWTLGVMYLLIAAVGIIGSVKTGKYIMLTKYLLLLLFDISALILCLFRNTTIQKIAIAIIVIFIIVNFGTTWIML